MSYSLLSFHQRWLTSAVITVILALSANNLFANHDLDENWDTSWDDNQPINALWGNWDIFIEGLHSQRWQADNHFSHTPVLSEARINLKWDTLLGPTKFKFSADSIYNLLDNRWQSRMHEFTWQSDLSFFGSWGRHFDLKIGQQILTWGLGDYVFLNDLFPKDYQSMLTGRDDALLKAPSQSVKLSAYSNWGNWDIVYTPEFSPDRYLTGEYLSFFDPQAGQLVAPNFRISSDNQPRGAEWALRWYHRVGRQDIALYSYQGYDKSPIAADQAGRPAFSQLHTYGASISSPLGLGVFKAEYAYYDAVENNSAQSPLLPNDQQRYLVGYEHEIFPQVTANLQWYHEQIENHTTLLQFSMTPQFEPPKNRSWITYELRSHLLQETLRLSAFNFYSPEQKDGHLRLKMTYSPNDRWRWQLGMNQFYGQQEHTFWGQFSNGSHWFSSYRYHL